MFEYKIEVIMTPHFHDCARAPYFWCVLCRCDSDWSNCGHGWATTPQEAWRRAYEYYDDITSV